MDFERIDMIEAVVRSVVKEMARTRSESSIKTETTFPSTPDNSRKCVFPAQKSRSCDDLEGMELHLDLETSSAISDRTIADIPSERTFFQSPARPKVGSERFLPDVLRRLGSRRSSLCIQSEHSLAPSSPPSSPQPAAKTKEFLGSVFRKLSLNSRRGSQSVHSEDKHSENTGNINVQQKEELDFEAAFGPNDMRCLALVSHNEMKATMKDFVIQYKHILKKFRLTGTNSTMKMLAEVFADEPNMVFGPACSSGPLGGDAELVALMTSGQLGGILFFQDPMTSHPHQCDIECLVRQAVVHNTLMANTPSSAMAFMEVFHMALMGVGKPELIPSFFFDLQSPTVHAYKNNQSKVIQSHAR